MLSLSWLMADQLAQLEALSGAGDGELKQAAGAMGEKETKQAMSQIRGWICRFATPSDLRPLSMRLLDIARRTEPSASIQTPVKPRHFRPAQSNLPRKGDGKACLDEKSDSSWLFFILETLGSLFEAVIRTSSSRIPEVPEVIKFSFDHLSHTFSKATQAGAAKCLSVLSECFLPQVISHFVTKMKTLRDPDAQREFTSYQRAVSGLQFSYGTADQRDATLLYTQSLLQMMQSIKRGVLQNEVCNSLADVIPRIMDSKVPESTRISLQTPYLGIFQCVRGWTQKDKLRDAGLRLLWTMEVHCGDYTMYSTKLTRTEDVFGMLVKSVNKTRLPAVAGTPLLQKEKKKDQPAKVVTPVAPNVALKGILAYLKKLPQEWVDRDAMAFSQKMGCFRDMIFAKKAPDSETQKELALILEEMGRKHLDFVMTDIMRPVLCVDPKTKRDEFDTKQKWVFLEALSNMAKFPKHDFEKSCYYWLGPAVAKFIKPEPKSLKKGVKETPLDKDDIRLLIAAVKCFPLVRPKEESRIEEVAAAVGGLTLRSEYGLPSQAVQAMQDLVELDMAKYLIPTLFCYIDILANLDANKREQCGKTLQILSWLVNRTRSNLAKEASPIIRWVSPVQWLALRQHFEGAALLWLVHHAQDVRFQVAHALASFCCSELRVLEGEESKRPPFLVDALFPDGDIEQSRANSFRDTLSNVVVNQYDAFRGIFSWTWTKMHESVDEAIPVEIPAVETPLEERVWYANYLAKLHFLCIALRMPPEEAVRKISVEKKENEAKRPHIFCPPPLLTDFRVQYLHAKNFFRKVFTVLHLPWQYKDYTKLCTGVAVELSHLHPSCYRELLTNLRRPMDEKDNVPSPLKRKSPGQDVVWPKQEFFHHQETIAVLALLLNKNKDSPQDENNACLYAVLDTLMTNWLQEKKEFAMDAAEYRCQTRCFMVDLISRSVTRSRRRDVIERTNIVTSSQTALFDLLTGLLEPEERPIPPLNFKRSTSQTPLPSATPVRSRKAIAGILTRRTNKTATRRPSAGEQPEDLASEVLLDENDPATVIELERGVLQGVANLVDACGTINDERFRDQLLRFVFKMGFRTDEVNDVHLAEVLKAFLRHHPHYVDDFIQKSFPGAHLTELNRRIVNTSIKSGPLTDEIRDLLRDPYLQNQKVPGTPSLATHANKMAGVYAKSVLSNFVRDIQGWTTDRISMPKVLLFLMLQQMAVTLSTRQGALELAKALTTVRLDKEPLDPGYEIRTCSHEAVPIYCQATLQYSADLARRAKGYPQIVSPLFQEAAALIGSKILDLKLCELLIRIVTPWASQIGVVLEQNVAVDKLNMFKSLANRDDADGKAEQKGRPPKGPQHSAVAAEANCVLQSIYRMTTLCHERDTGLVTPALQALWGALLSEEYADTVIPQVVRFLVHQYAAGQSVEKGDDDPSPKNQVRFLARNEEKVNDASSVHSLPKMFLLQLSRATEDNIHRTHAPLIVKELLRHIRNCDDICPVETAKYLEWQNSQTEAKEEITSIEKYAFELVVNLVFENGKLFVEHFPTLLQNAVVMLPGTSEADSLISYVALNLGIHPEEGQSPFETLVYNICQQQHCDLAKRWSLMCVQWAVNTKSEKIATASLKMFQTLQTTLQDAFDFGENQLVLIQLVTSLYLALRLEQIDRVRALVDIFLMPTAIPLCLTGWNALTAAGWAMLCLSKELYFKAGLQLLVHLFANEPVSVEEEKAYLQVVGEKLVFFRRPTPLGAEENESPSEPVDKAIAEVALKGFSSATTSQDTLCVLQALVPFYSEQLPPNNKLMALLLLGNVLLRSIDMLESAREQRAHSDASKHQVNQQNLYHVSRAKDCLNMCAVLKTYKMPENPTIDTSLRALSQSMLELAKHSAEHLPVRNLIDPKWDMAQLQSRVDDELARRRALIQPGFEDSASRAILTASQSSQRVTQFLGPFFQAFAGVFGDRESFNFVIEVLTRLLKYGHKSWSMVLLEMLGLYIKFAPHRTSSAQFLELTELLVVASHSAKKDVERLARETAYEMAHKTEFQGTEHAFNFLRPVTLREEKKAEGVLMGRVNGSAESEKQDCLTRMAKQTFLLLEYMRTNPRRYQQGVISTIKPPPRPGGLKLNIPARFPSLSREHQQLFPSLPREDNTPQNQHFKFSPDDHSESQSLLQDNDMVVLYTPDEDGYVSSSPSSGDRERERVSGEGFVLHSPSAPPRSPESASYLIAPEGRSSGKKRKPGKDENEQPADNLTSIHLPQPDLPKSPIVPPKRAPPSIPAKR